MARAIGKSQGHDAASADMTPASARFIFLGRSHCLRDRASRTAHILHAKLRRQLSLSFPPLPPPYTLPFKIWVQHGAPALAISFFPLAQSAAPTAWKESWSEYRNCLDHSRNHAAVPPRITGGTTMANTTTLSSKFQIAIPKEVREAQDWKSGQEFDFIPKCGGQPSRSLFHNPGSTLHRQGRNHHQLQRSQGPRLMRVVDTSAWIGWLIGWPLERAVLGTPQSGIPG